MKSVLLIGLGRFGRYVAQTLNELGDEVLAIDKDEEKVNQVLGYVTNAQIGDGTNERFIASLGVNNFELCIVAIGGDFLNSLETTSLLKDYGAPFVLSQAMDERHAKFLRRNGADDVVFLEKQMASWTAIKYSNDSIFDYMDISDDYAIYETVMPGSWYGRPAGELKISENYSIQILATKRDGSIIPFSEGHIFQENERLLIFGERSKMKKFLML